MRTISLVFVLLLGLTAELWYPTVASAQYIHVGFSRDSLHRLIAIDPSIRDSAISRSQEILIGSVFYSITGNALIDYDQRSTIALYRFISTDSLTIPIHLIRTISTALSVRFGEPTKHRTDPEFERWVWKFDKTLVRLQFQNGKVQYDETTDAELLN